MTDPGLEFRLLDGRAAGERADDFTGLHAEVYADPPYRRADDGEVYPGRFRVQRRQPGFVLAEARHGGFLVGYAAGMPLRPSTSWWRELTTALPARSRPGAERVPHLGLEPDRADPVRGRSGRTGGRRAGHHAPREVLNPAWARLAGLSRAVSPRRGRR